MKTTFIGRVLCRCAGRGVTPAPVVLARLTLGQCPKGPAVWVRLILSLKRATTSGLLLARGVDQTGDP